jgi:hypothetical protein
MDCQPLSLLYQRRIELFIFTVILVFIVTLMLGWPFIMMGGLSILAFHLAREESTWLGKIFFLIQSLGFIAFIIIVTIGTITRNGLPGVLGMGLGILFLWYIPHDKK